MGFCLRQEFISALVSILLVGSVECHLIGQTQQDEKTFRIMYGDNQLGLLKAKKEQQIASTTYHLLTDLKASLIKEFHITYNLSVKYDTGSMVMALIKSAVNQNTWDSTHVQWENNKYRVHKAGEAVYYKKQRPCSFSTACMYFQQPQSDEVFSEQYTKKVPVKEVRSNVFKLALPSGNANFYHYDNRGLAKVVVNDTPVQVRFIRI